MKINLFAKARITHEDLKQCLDYYEAETRILAFQTKEADLFNNKMVKYLESITEDVVAAREMCDASNRHLRAMQEVLRRHENIYPVPKAAFSMRCALHLAFLAVTTWAEATMNAMESIEIGMKPHNLYIQHLVVEYQTAWRKAQKEGGKFLRRLNVAPEVIEKIMKRCSEAAEADNWQPKSVFLKSYHEESAPNNNIHPDNTQENLLANQRTAQVYCARGDAHRRKLEQDLALADYTKAIEIAPEFAQSYYDRGRAYRAKNEYDLAILDFTKAIEIDAKSDIGYMERGHAFTDKCEYELAIADYTKVIEANPSFVGGYYYRAQAYIKKGEYEHAMLDFKKVVEIQPITVLGQAAHYNLGCIYMKKGDKDSAMEHYEALKKLNEEPANMLLDRINSMAECSSKSASLK
jgi:tetratricopeptide (TPR) repeat protein